MYSEAGANYNKMFKIRQPLAFFFFFFKVCVDELRAIF